MKNIIKKILKEELGNKPHGKWENNSYVLYDDKGKIGSGTLYPFDESAMSGFYVREDGEQQYTVMGLSVHPDYRRKGYAKEIIRQMENKCIEEGVDKLYILVDKNNVSAINLYRDMGYKEVTTPRRFMTLVKEFSPE